MDEIDLSKNEEIQNALKEFEEKNAAEERKMIPLEKKIASSSLVAWVIKRSGGKITDERQAEYVLLAFVVVMIIFAVVLLMAGGPEEVPLTTPFYT